MPFIGVGILPDRGCVRGTSRSANHGTTKPRVVLWINDRTLAKSSAQQMSERILALREVSEGSVLGDVHGALFSGRSWTHRSQVAHQYASRARPGDRL